MMKLAIAVFATVAAFGAVGCSSDDEVAATPNDTGVAVTDTGSATDTGSGSDSATDAGSLYDRLGGNAGIKGAIDAIVADELKDTQIAAFFVNNDGTHAGHPSATQIKECLVLLLGNAAGGPEVYPGKVSGDFMCRSMKVAHTGLGISATVFDKFVGIAAATLKKAGVADADIATIGAVLNGTKTDIVEAADGGA